MNVSHRSRKSDHILKKERLSVLDSLFVDNIDIFVKNCFVNEELKEKFESYVLNSIQTEVRHLCSKQANSVLRQNDFESLKSLNWNTIMTEWEENAPTFKKFLEAVTSNPSHQRNKLKKGEALIPGLASAGCKLLTVYNKEMNALQHVNSMILLKGGCKKSAFTRLNSTHDVLSYPAVLHAVDKYGERWSDELRAWSTRIKQESDIERRMIQEIKDVKDVIQILSEINGDYAHLIFHLADLENNLELHRQSMHNGFYFVGDNVDMVTKVRHMTLQNQNKDQHLFQTCAYQNRISGNQLDNTRPKGDIMLTPFSQFIPSVGDRDSLHEDFSFLVAKQWTTLIPCLRVFGTVLPDFINHKYSKELTEKSVRVSHFNYLKFLTYTVFRY